MRRTANPIRCVVSVPGLLIALFLCSGLLQAQKVNIWTMSREELAAYFAKLRAVAQVDRQKMLDLLGIRIQDSLPPPTTDPNRLPNLTQLKGSTNWYDAAGNTYVRSEWGTWTNYDEAKAGGYTLPDPLILNNGRTVRDAETWWKQRRPEILEHFEKEVYGRIPKATPKVTFEVTETDTSALEGRAVKKTVVGHIDNSRYPAATPSIEITLYVPAKATGPVPLMVIVGGFFGPFPGQPRPQGPSAMDQVLALGWAFATVDTGAIQMDSGAGLDKGIIGLVNRGRSRKPDQWGVLAAWSWGLSRALDYFETDKSIDSKRIGIEGHSRWGKTALLAGALDRRWAIVYSSCSGSMGASLEKRNWGETIDNVAGVDEYHWMAGNFLKFGGHWAEMPVDAHELIALVAPRPIFVTGGTQDQWSDPHGEFLACVGADPVYRLLGKKGLGTTEMPAPDVALTEGDLAFREHEGGHTDLLDWPVFLKFAQRYFGK
ncbi:MAG: acetylxylan esterase [Acidobacteriota bacterium]